MLQGCDSDDLVLIVAATGLNSLASVPYVIAMTALVLQASCTTLRRRA